MNKRYFLTHSIEYFFLSAIFLSSLLSLFLLNDKLTKNIVAFSLMLIYLVWGFVHHAIEHDLKLSTILEYSAIATLILWVLISLGS